MRRSIEKEKILERGALLKRAFPKVRLYQIGRELDLSYFKKIPNGWRIKEDEDCLILGAALNDDLLMKILKKYKPREWAVFRGRYYVLQDGKLRIGGFGKHVEEAIRRAKALYGSDVVSVLKSLLKRGGTASLTELKKDVKSENLEDVLGELTRLNLIVLSYEGDKYKEWQILEETIPLIEAELGLKSKRAKRRILSLPREIQISKISDLSADEEIKEKRPPDPLGEERERIRKMDREFDKYLEDLLKHRLEKTIKFGKQFGIEFLAAYLRELFGSVLYFDSLLSITQQYGLANVKIIHEKGETGRKTGWSLALFGDPGTGKSFSTRDMILGKPNAKIGAHGLPGRNRYCGGMTPAFFIRIGEAYAGRVFNFIVPEFNDFFRYKGMVEPLKIAMEQGEIKYETHNEVIGPYRFTSFFSVNYNVSVHDRGYDVTIQDPNFNAIEDRMLCRLHRLTKERFIEITKSQMKLALGTIDVEKDSQKIRDHLTLVYAIETGHPLVQKRFKFKPVMITPRVFEIIGKTRAAILERIPERVLKFSARLEDKALRFACAASLMDYFRRDEDFIPISEEALKYAAQLYVEEASIRSREAFKPDEVLDEIFKDFG